MKKLLKIAAISTIALAAQTAQAMTWEVVCVKQGPVRGCPSKPLRVLSPSAGNPGNTPGYPIGLRSIPSKAAIAEKSDVPQTMNFFSLGFGGVIILRSSAWIGNGPGADVTVYETTWGNPSCRPGISESALIEFSQDGEHWVAPDMGDPSRNWNACHNASFDITPLEKAQYVRITDRTNPDRLIRGDGNDGYDVDGVEANYEIPPAGGTPPSGPVCEYQQGVASQFVGAPGNFPGRGIVIQRQDFAKANINEAGFPVEAFSNPGLRDSGPANGTFNFWSLGFGGWACFHLPYTVFDGPGPDIYSFETTWQNQPCPDYPEKADVSVSVDGINWSQPIRICKDALSISGADNAIDLNGFGPGYSVINYIRYADATNPADFGAGADGYDIDNIYLAQMPPEAPGTLDPGFLCWGDSGIAARRALPQGASLFMDGGIPEEMFPLEISGSTLVDDVLRFRATIVEAGEYSYTIRNSSGQELANGMLEGALYETPETEFSVANLAPGVYFLSLRSPNSHESLRFVKR